MQGRYGSDQFSRFLIGVDFVLIFLSLFIRKNQFLSVVVMGILVYVYFRTFSKNISKRYAENQKYLGYTQKVRSQFAREKNMMEQRKTHHIYTCPGCGQKIRIPRGKGQKVEIECPKCHAKFIKRR